MKVFISWSGPRSRAAAKELADWLELVTAGNIDPWMSDNDLEKGSRWATGIGKALEGSQAGISVLTPENLNSTWLNFEAGAVGKAFDESRVMTLLIGLKPAEVPMPLGQFQATTRSLDELSRLVTDLNRFSDQPTKDHILARLIAANWNELDEKLNAIEQQVPADTPPRRDQYEMLEEALTLLRAMSRQVPGVEVGNTTARNLWVRAAESLHRSFGSEVSDNDAAVKTAQELARYIRSRDPLLAVSRIFFDPEASVMVIATDIPPQEEVLTELGTQARAAGLNLAVGTEEKIAKLPFRFVQIM